MGSEVHRWAEQVARGGDPDVPTEHLGYVEAYRRWLVDDTPELVSVEKFVAAPTAGYAGTYDLLARLDGRLYLLDIKTWKRAPRVGSDMYAETALQLAAYGYAEFIGLPNDPKRYAMPPLDGFGVLHLRPDLYATGYAVIPFDVTDAEYDAFLAALRIYRWKADRARSVITERKKLEVAA